MAEAWFLIVFLVSGENIGHTVQVMPKWYANESLCRAAADERNFNLRKGDVGGALCLQGWRFDSSGAK